MNDDGASLHEQRMDLGPEVLDRHRAIRSLIEELEAVDWYDQRVQATADRELAEILMHNRDEEKEHAAMILEWLRRRDAGFAEELRTYLETPVSITAAEGEVEANTEVDVGDPRALGLGSLKEEES